MAERKVQEHDNSGWKSQLKRLFDYLTRKGLEILIAIKGKISDFTE